MNNTILYSIIVYYSIYTYTNYGKFTITVKDALKTRDQNQIRVTYLIDIALWSPLSIRDVHVG